MEQTFPLLLTHGGDLHEQVDTTAAFTLGLRLGAQGFRSTAVEENGVIGCAAGTKSPGLRLFSRRTTMIPLEEIVGTFPGLTLLVLDTDGVNHLVFDQQVITTAVEIWEVCKPTVISETTPPRPHAKTWWRLNATQMATEFEMFAAHARAQGITGLVAPITAWSSARVSGAARFSLQTYAEGVCHRRHAVLALKLGVDVVDTRNVAEVYSALTGSSL